jgi:hypothetical protein
VTSRPYSAVLPSWLLLAPRFTLSEGRYLSRSDDGPGRLTVLVVSLVGKASMFTTLVRQRTRCG